MTILELRIERLATGGDAIAREASGRVVFVAGGLPDEVVEAELTEEKRDFARATVTAILEASPDRTVPPCPAVAAGCGGCTWQHIRPGAQPELKRAIVADSLTRIGHLEAPDVRSGPPLDPWGFRTTLRLAVVDGRAGFRAHRSHRVVEVDDCLVAHPLLAELLATSRFPGAHEVTLRAGANTGERLALVEPTGAGADVVVPPDVAVGRRTHIHEIVAGARLQIGARSFFQTRQDGAEALVALVREAAGEWDGAIVDAYAGVGLFAATLAPAGSDVVAVEQSWSSCADARVNLGRRATVIHSPVEGWRPRRAGLVVADPSRRGLGPDAVRVLASTQAPRFVLVSCDPAALARDAHLLAAAGYDHQRSTVVDLFPHTPHVEVVTSFARR